MKKNSIEVLKAQSNPIFTKVKYLIIKDTESLSEGVELLSRLNKFNDQISAEKEKVTVPLNQALKAERARWKPLETMYEEAITKVRTSLTSYQVSILEKQKKEEQKILNDIEKGKINNEEGVHKLALMAEAPRSVVTNSGRVMFKIVRKFEVIDIAKLPIEYHVANEMEIRKTMAYGRELPGVRYYDEPVPYNSR
jgi:hypothetical protein